jgi:hypothetical protein
MNYKLKDKITTTEELLSELETKSWQEIEYLQAQITNLAEGPTNDKLRQLFKNLLTSYYVFAGGIETLIGEPEYKVTEPIKPEAMSDVDKEIIEPAAETINDFTPNNTHPVDNYEAGEPFEYFVDFDEPVGEPISDDDLYNN